MTAARGTWLNDQDLTLTSAQRDLMTADVKQELTQNEDNIVDV
jgi:hypothetical protein